jgi:hypothetical protein
MRSRRKKELIRMYRISMIENKRTKLKFFHIVMGDHKSKEGINWDLMKIRFLIGLHEMDSIIIESVNTQNCPKSRLLPIKRWSPNKSILRILSITPFVNSENKCKNWQSTAYIILKPFEIDNVISLIQNIISNENLSR